MINNYIYYLESIYFEDNTFFSTHGKIDYNEKRLPENLAFTHNDCKIYIDWFSSGDELNRELTLLNKNKFKNKSIYLYEVTKGSAKKTYYADGKVIIVPQILPCLLKNLSFLKTITRKNYKSQIFEQIVDNLEKYYKLNENDFRFFVNKEIKVRNTDVTSLIKGDIKMDHVKNVFISEAESKKLVFGIKTSVAEYYFKSYNNGEIIWTKNILYAESFETKNTVYTLLYKLKENKSLYNSILDNTIDGKIKIFRIKRELVETIEK